MTLPCVYKAAEIRGVFGARRETIAREEPGEKGRRETELRERVGGFGITGVYRRENLSFAWNSQHDRL